MKIRFNPSLRYGLAVGAILGQAIYFMSGCSSFVNSSQKTLYATSQIADAAMKSYGTYWKFETNQAGFITDFNSRQQKLAALWQQRSNVDQLSFEVGSALGVASKALVDYQTNVGTNTTTQAIVNALILTAVQRAGSLAELAAILAGKTNTLSNP